MFNQRMSSSPPPPPPGPSIPRSLGAAAAHPSPIARLVAAKVGFPAPGELRPFAPSRAQAATALVPATRPTLRLVREPAEAVAQENRLAASIPALDARWAFAVRVADTLEGGRLAMLRPERRRRLVTQARRAGLRDFDTNLVIAIVQDAARCGEPMDADGVTRRIALVRPPEDAMTADHAHEPGRASSAASAARLLSSRRWLEAVLVALLASGALWAMIRWVTRG